MLSEKTRGEIYQHLKGMSDHTIEYITGGNLEKAAKIYEYNLNFESAALTWKKAGKLDRAAEAYEKDLSQFDSMKKKRQIVASIGYRGEILENAARCWEQAGKSDKAKEAFEKAIVLYGEDIDWVEHKNESERIIAHCADLEEKLGRPETAREMRAGLRKREVWISPLGAILGIVGGIFFLSSNITGNAIGSQTISNWVGATFLIVGLIAGFFWVKNRKKK